MRSVLKIVCLAAAVALCPAAVWSQVTLSIGSTATLRADAVTLSLSGNLHCDGRFDPAGGTLVLNGRGTQRLISDNPHTVNNLVVRKASGDVILTNDLNVKSRLSIERGYLDLDGFSLALGPNAEMQVAEPGRVRGALGTISASAEIRNVQDFNLGGLGLVVTTRANLGNVSVTRGHIARRIRGVTGINRSYDLTAARTPDRDVVLLFEYEPGELNNLHAADLTMYRSTDDGETWDAHEGTVVPDSNYIRVVTRQVSGLWTAGSRHLAASVMIRDLAASVRQHEAVITWTAVSQMDISGFEIQVGEDEAYETHDFVEVTATTGLQNFTYTLAGLPPGRHVVRIKPVLSSGEGEASEALEINLGAAGLYTLSEPYPNPFTSRTAVTLNISTSQHVMVEVFDLQARRVALLHDGPVAAGDQMEFVFEAPALPSGIYLFRVTGEYFSSTRRVTLVR